MKKLLVLNLGLILALASSSAFAVELGKVKEKSGTEAHDLSGDVKGDAHAEALKAGDVANRNKQSEQTQSGDLSTAVNGSKTPAQRADAAMAKLTKMSDFGVHTAKVQEILKDNSLNSQQKADKIGLEIGRSGEEVIANCEL